MLDKNGKELHVGDWVWWASFDEDVIGVVRTIHAHACICDNGDPANPDPETNGFSVIARLKPSQMKRLDAEALAVEHRAVARANRRRSRPPPRVRTPPRRGDRPARLPLGAA